MDKGWEVDEEQYFEHLMTNQLYKVETKQSTLATQTFHNDQTPKTRSRLRFRTASMPKLFEGQPPVDSPKKIRKDFNENKSPIKSPLKSPLKTPIRQKVRSSLKSTLFQNPIDEGGLKMGRTLQPKQFNPLYKLNNEPTFSGMKGQTRSVKSASMSNLFNEERVQTKKRLEDFVFKLKPQRNANIIYMNVAIRSQQEVLNEDLIQRRLSKLQQ